MTKRKQFLSGIKAGFPVLFGYVPVAIAYSVTASLAGLSGFETVLMSVMVFAGASQIMAAGMLIGNASIFSIVVTTFILNFRHLIMSICVSAKLTSVGLPLKLLAAFGITDESFAITTTAENKHSSSVFYLLGVILITYLSWILGTVIGVIANTLLPEIVSKSCSVALYAMFIALLMPNVLKSIKLFILVIITAATNFILTLLIDSSYALIISALFCAGLGVLFIDEEEI